MEMVCIKNRDFFSDISKFVNFLASNGITNEIIISSNKEDIERITKLKINEKRCGIVLIKSNSFFLCYRKNIDRRGEK